MKILPVLTLTMGSILVLMTQIAFSEEVEVVIRVGGGGESYCEFVDPQDPDTVQEVYSPDKAKVVLKKGRATGTCQDKDVVTNSGKPIVFQGYDHSCTMHYGLGGFARGSYEQVSSKSGSTLTCVQTEPQGFPG